MRKGFTLIELMIVIAIIAIIAAIAIPNLLESRITSNESAAATSLKSGLHPAEVQFQGGNYADNIPGTYEHYTPTAGAGVGNGIGDFAWSFNQMAGADPATGLVAGVGALQLSLLPPTWGDIAAVPNGGAAWGGVAGAGPTGPNINNYIFHLAAMNENGFACTATPSDGLDSIGRRRFAINASGTVYATPAGALNPVETPTSGTGPFAGGNPAVVGAGPFNQPSGVQAAGATGNWTVHKK